MDKGNYYINGIVTLAQNKSKQLVDKDDYQLVRQTYKFRHRRYLPAEIVHKIHHHNLKQILKWISAYRIGKLLAYTKQVSQDQQHLQIG